MKADGGIEYTSPANYLQLVDIYHEVREHFDIMYMGHDIIRADIYPLSSTLIGDLD